MLKLKLLFITALSILLNGQAFAIIGGREVPSTDPLKYKIVLIYLRNTSQGASICTGSLLPDNIILTAAHCLVDVKKKDVVLVFGPNVQCAKDKQCPTFGVKDMAIHEQYASRRKIEIKLAKAKKKIPQKSLSASVDLAVIKIDGQAPPEYQPFTRLGFPNTKPEEIVQVGFGATNALGEGMGHALRSTQKSITDLSTQKNLPLIMVHQPDTGVCHGDSGGPLVMQNEFEAALTGVGDSVINKDPNPEKICSSAAVYTRVDMNLPWINAAIAKLNAGSN